MRTAFSLLPLFSYPVVRGETPPLKKNPMDTILTKIVPIAIVAFLVLFGLHRNFPLPMVRSRAWHLGQGHDA